MLLVYQLEESEGELLTQLLDAAHKIRLRSEAGDYKGAIKNPKEFPAAKALADDLTALNEVAKLARPAVD